MSEEGRRRGLGRGLSALLGEEEEAVPAAGVRSVPIERLHRGRFQPRRNFDEESLNALVESITAQGILQPLLVRPHPERPEDFEILAGERRWRAAQRALLREVPVVVRAADDRAALEVALVENVQRQDLSAIEEAAGYQRLIAEFGHTQDDLARALGKSRSHIANTLRLLHLPEAVRRLVEEGRLSAGHARALLGAKDPVALAEEAIAGEMNVRQLERRVRTEQEVRTRRAAGEAVPGYDPPPAPLPDPNIAAAERDLSRALGLDIKVALDRSGRGGTLTLRFLTLDQYDDIVRRLMAEG